MEDNNCEDCECEHEEERPAWRDKLDVWLNRLFMVFYATVPTLWIAWAWWVSGRWDIAVVAAIPCYAAYRFGRTQRVARWMREHDEQLARLQEYVDSLEAGDEEVDDEPECEPCKQQGEEPTE